MSQRQSVEKRAHCHVRFANLSGKNVSLEGQICPRKTNDQRDVSLVKILAMHTVLSKLPLLLPPCQMPSTFSAYSTSVPLQLLLKHLYTQFDVSPGSTALNVYSVYSSTRNESESMRSEDCTWWQARQEKCNKGPPVVNVLNEYSFIHRRST